MELEAFKALAERCLKKNEVLTAFVRCKIYYFGRAEAELDFGDRLLIIKQDNTLLIHQPENGSPINYLKPGSTVNFNLSEDILELNANIGTDYLKVEIKQVFDAINAKLDDGQKQRLVGTEADMSDMIRDNPHHISEDFRPLSREEHTKYGFIDVFGHDGEGNLVIVECKRYAASLACVTQLRRYVEKMKKLKGTENVVGIMASPKITPNAEGMLQDWGFTWKRVVPPKRLMKAKNQTRLGEW